MTTVAAFPDEFNKFQATRNENASCWVKTYQSTHWMNVSLHFLLQGHKDTDDQKYEDV